MNPRHQGLFLLAILIALSYSSSSSAQSKLQSQVPVKTSGGPPAAVPSISGFVKDVPSHETLSDVALDPADAKALLEQRLGKAKSDKELEKILQQMLKDFKPEDLTKEDLQNLQKIAKQQNVGKLPNLDEKQFADLKEKLKGVKLDELTPENVDALKQIQKQQNGESIDFSNELVHDFMKKIGPDWVKDHPEAKKNTALQDWLHTQTIPELKAGPGPTSSQELVPHQDGPIGGPAGMQGQPPAPWPTHGYGHKSMGTTGPTPPSWLGKQFLSLVDKMTEGDQNSKSSVAKFLKELAKSDSAKPADGQGLASNMGKVGEMIPTSQLSHAGSFFGNMKLPSFPQLPSMAPVPKSGVPAVSAATGEGTINVLIGGLILVAVGLVIWKLLSMRGGPAVEADLTKLPGWPVHPSAVQTRADLVRAFEYLAVLLLGQSARTRNHLELAKGMGGQNASTNDPRPEAARALAHLYEIARYTPAHETLPPDELDAARRELSFLAGAASQ
jgi:hypothetical protein